MELQALATYRQTLGERFLRAQQRLSTGLPFICIEDLILVVTLVGAHPDLRSLWVGGTMSVTALVLLLWVQGFAMDKQEAPVIGPFRFVRHPQRLSLWLLALGFSLGSRSFPGLILSLGLLPCLYYFDLHREEEQRRRQKLAAFRYGKFVPALVPTIFPYQREISDLQFSWKTAFFGADHGVRRRLGRFILGWVLIALLQREIIPLHGAWIAAGLWLVIVAIRIVLHRKTVRLIFH